MEFKDWVLFAVGIVLGATSLTIGIFCAFDGFAGYTPIAWVGGWLFIQLTIGFYKDMKSIANDTRQSISEGLQ